MFRRLLPYVSRYRRAFLIGLVCVVLTTAFQLLGPWVLKFAIDDLNRGVTRQKLLLYAGLLLGVSLVRGSFLFLMRRIIIAASRDIEYDIRNDFFARLEQQPLGYYHQRRTGDLMSRATNDLNAVRMMIGPAIMYSAQTVLVFVVTIALMVAIDLRLTLIALIPLPFVSLAVRYFGSAIHKRFESIQAQLADVSAVVQEALSGVRVVRAYRQESHEIARFNAANEEYLHRNRVLIRLQGAFYPSMTLFLALGSLLVLWLGGREVIHGRISLGEFVAFNGYLVMLSWPMIAFGWVTNILQRGLASWGRMLEILDHEPAITDAAATEAGRAAAMDGAIEIRDLTFQYPGTAAPVLKHITLRIEPGQTVALVGPTGSGKSTLISLLPRLHDPPSGTVTVGGVDIREIPLARLRGAVGFVPQEPFLFSDTIAENVAFGAAEQGVAANDAEAKEAADQADHADAADHADHAKATDHADHAERESKRLAYSAYSAATQESKRSAYSADSAATQESKRSAYSAYSAATKESNRSAYSAYSAYSAAVVSAASVARLDKDVADFPRGFDTTVGERGITLSGGQKQRTALARALMTDPRILILDDALSAVDTYTEEEILSRLRGVMRQRTSIIVSHRISTVRGADQIFVLHDGRVAERGTHDDLVRRDGLYAAMYRKQLLEEELQAS
ncbi:MAG TPA: ABC transporter ATP-binding protein [Vicinamibacterales bacterium]|nr:ABC transporter ATP-binding protein [Vicinamibacterales bacterium]